MKKVIVVARGRYLVDESTEIIKEHGFDAVGVTRDEDALALLDTGEFAAVVVGGGVEQSSRGPLKEHADRHGTVVFEVRRLWTQSVQDHVRDVIVPKLLQLG